MNDGDSSDSSDAHPELDTKQGGLSDPTAADTTASAPSTDSTSSFADEPVGVNAGEGMAHVGATEASELPAYPRIGDVIDGRYEVVGTLGRGAFGSVHAVVHRKLRQRFALKILDPRIARDPRAVERFNEEARATSLTGHENVVFVTDFAECPRFGHFLVMEYLDGESLEALMESGQGFGPEEILGFAHEVGSGLAAVHELGIVHRDLKPANLMRAHRAGGATWKILDFGISSGVAAVTQDALLAGTPRYMAPEQAMGRIADHRADIFSLGCILYEMLTGEPPWETRSWLDALPENRTAKKPDTLEVDRDDIPEGFGMAVLRALEVDPDDRWPDVESFVTELQSTSGLTPAPSLDPFDHAETARALEEQTEARRALEEDFGDQGLGENLSSAVADSVSILVDDAGPETPVVRLSFKSADRLRREYRRNIVAGGLFVPSLHRPPLNAEVRVDIRFEPAQRGISVRATIVNHSDEPSGFGVGLSPPESTALLRFLRSLSVNLDLIRESNELPAIREGRNDTRRAQELADYFEERRNYLAAIRVLEEAVASRPDAEIFARLARLRADFEFDLPGAAEAVGRAIGLAPHNLAYRDLAARIEELQNLDSSSGLVGEGTCVDEVEPNIHDTLDEAADDEPDGDSGS